MNHSILAYLLTFSLFSLTPLYAQKAYRGAEVYSNNSVLYGKFEMRMKMVKGSGLLSTFFTYKDDSWQPDTYWEEIDIEILGKNNANILSSNIILDGTVEKTVHYMKEINLNYSLADDFHTYTLEWTPKYVAWYIDGIELRRETDSAVIKNLKSPQSYRFNAWASCSPEWVGAIDKENLPQYQYIDWIEYSRYDNDKFTFEWRDDFNNFDLSRWSKATWTFDCNETDFVEENAFINANGQLVLAITDPNSTKKTIKKK